MADLIRSFHAHIYYDMATKDVAVKLREHFQSITYSDKVLVGKMHDAPVGPHTQPMFYIGFNGIALREILNALILRHNELSVLIHPETGDELKDHTQYAMWLGVPIPLDLSKL